MRRSRAARTAIAVAAAVMLAACGTADTSGGGTSGSGGAGSEELARNGTADGAVKGGTLNMLGAGDVDYIDPNITYYSAGYVGVPALQPPAVHHLGRSGDEEHGRARPGRAAPDADNGGVSADGKTYTITIRAGRAVGHHAAAAGDGGRRGASASSAPATRCSRSAACRTTRI